MFKDLTAFGNGNLTIGFEIKFTFVFDKTFESNGREKDIFNNRSGVKLVYLGLIVNILGGRDGY